MSRNPFYIGKPVPPEAFIGRIRDITFAFDLIAQKGHLSIFGGRGIGKSSLLQYLAAPQAWEAVGYDFAGTLVVLLNCSFINPFQPAAFWREVLVNLKDKADKDALLQTKIETVLATQEPGPESLRSILGKLRLCP